MRLFNANRARAWAYLVLAFAILSGYGALWSRGIQGDDICMCELASANSFRDALRIWLDTANGRVFQAMAHIGTYRLPWFSDPVSAPWYLIHGIALIGHFFSCVMLLRLVTRAGVSMASALAATLLLAIHPITHQPLLWLAASYAYVLGNLLVLMAVWAYLRYESSGKLLWLGLAAFSALVAMLGIEQYLFVFGALVVANLFRGTWSNRLKGRWLPFLIVACFALAILALHFLVFSGSGARLERALSGGQSVAGTDTLWRLAWWFSLVPGHSYFDFAWHVGLKMLSEHVILVVLVLLVALASAWRVAAAGSWHAPDQAVRMRWHGKLLGVGILVFVAALLPFALTGKYGFDSRNVYVALPGLVLVVAVLLDWLDKVWSGRCLPRYVLATLVAGFVALSLTIDIGMQSVFARAWLFHKEMVFVINEDADAIRTAGGVEITDIPENPYKAIAQMDNGWAFPCLVRWTLRDNNLKAWNNLMSNEDRARIPAGSHRIHWRGE